MPAYRSRMFLEEYPILLQLPYLQLLSLSLFSYYYVHLLFYLQDIESISDLYRILPIEKVDIVEDLNF
jgi:hypothetical protein